MSNPFYTPSGAPVTGSAGLSAIMRSEFAAVGSAFDKLPPSLTPNKVVIINSGGTGMTVTSGGLALAGDFTTTGAFNTTLVQQASVSLTLPAASTVLVGRDSTDTFTNKTISGSDNTLSNIGNGSLANSSITIGSTSVSLGGTVASVSGLSLVAPALGTPTSGVLSNCTGLPISTGISGLGAGVATLLASVPSGTGGLVGKTAPTITGLTMAGNISLNGSYLSGDGGNEGLLITSSGVASFNPTGTRYGAVFNPMLGDGGVGYVYVDSVGAGFTNASPFQEMFYCDRGAARSIVYAGGAARVTVASSGGVQFNAYGAGTLQTDSSGVITASSDERIKTNIRPFTRGMPEIMMINPILHGYTPQSGLDQTRDDYAGFSAQNIRSAIPEAVDGVDLLTLSDKPIIAALVNAVKELNSRLLAHGI